MSPFVTPVIKPYRPDCNWLYVLLWCFDAWKSHSLFLKMSLAVLRYRLFKINFKIILTNPHTPLHKKNIFDILFGIIFNLQIEFETSSFYDSLFFQHKHVFPICKVLILYFSIRFYTFLWNICYKREKQLIFKYIYLVTNQLTKLLHLVLGFLDI